MLSTHELADAIGVSESSLKRWVDSGRIVGQRTDGGHRRIPWLEAMRFIRHERTPLERPELLGLPEIAVDRTRREPLFTYLREGDEVAAHGFFASRYLGGMSIAELADGPVREAMHAVGQLWLHDTAGIYLEHRASEICLHAISALRQLMQPVPRGAPRAVGGAPTGDPYLLPSLLVQLALIESRIHAVNLGPDTPLDAMRAAVAQLDPDVVWVSISATPSRAVASGLVRWFASLPASVAVIIGGHQADRLDHVPPRVWRASSMGELAARTAALAQAKTNAKTNAKARG